MRLRAVRAVRAWPLLAALALPMLLSGCAGEGVGQGGVPVHRVERQDFVHKVTAEGVLQAGRSTQLTVPPQVVATVRLSWLMAEGTPVEEGDVVARFDAKAMREKLTDAEMDRRRSDRRIDQTSVEKGQRVEELHADARIAELELEHARSYQRTDADVFSRRELVEDAIDERLAGERKKHAQSNAVTEQELARTELELLEIDRRQASDEMREARQGLEALEVRAPHGGLLTYSRNWRGEPPSVGSEMFRGQSLAEIPDLDSLEAEVYVLEADAGGLAEGQRAEVVVEAHPEVVLAAEIRRLDPVAQPRLRGSPVQYFGVVLAFADDEEQRAILRAMKPGQRVRAILFLESLDDVLVVPRQAVRDEDGEARVWRRGGFEDARLGEGGFEAVEVEVAATGLGMVVISAGLEEGDEVALRPPEEGAGGPAPDGGSGDPGGGSGAGGAGAGSSGRTGTAGGRG